MSKTRRLKSVKPNSISNCYFANWKPGVKGTTAHKSGLVDFLHCGHSLLCDIVFWIPVSFYRRKHFILKILQLLLFDKIEKFSIKKCVCPLRLLHSLPRMKIAWDFIHYWTVFTSSIIVRFELNNHHVDSSHKLSILRAKTLEDIEKGSTTVPFTICSAFRISNTSWLICHTKR